MSQEQTAYSATDEVTSFLEKRTAWSRTKILLRKSPATARFGMIVIAIYILVAIFAPWIAPYGEAEVFAQPYAPWGGEHLLGTDQIGRDIYSRMIYGARNTVGIALVTTILAFVIGGGLGLAAAINRSWLDQLLSRGVDVLMAIPSLIFAITYIFLNLLADIIGIITNPRLLHPK